MFDDAVFYKEEEHMNGCSMARWEHEGQSIYMSKDFFDTHPLFWKRQLYNPRIRVYDPTLHPEAHRLVEQPNFVRIPFMGLKRAVLEAGGEATIGSKVVYFIIDRELRHSRKFIEYVTESNQTMQIRPI